MSSYELALGRRGRGGAIGSVRRLSYDVTEKPDQARVAAQDRQDRESDVTHLTVLLSFSDEPGHVLCGVSTRAQEEGEDLRSYRSDEGAGIAEDLPEADAEA